MRAITGNPLPPLLVSLCARLRTAAGTTGPLGEQAASAIETLWADNRRLTVELLDIERRIQRAMSESGAIGKFGTLRSAGEPHAR